LEYKDAITDPTWLLRVNNIAGQSWNDNRARFWAIGQLRKFYRSSLFSREVLNWSRRRLTLLVP
jgi:hypothetical protein